MAAAVPTVQPSVFNAGDSLLFDISLADYSAGDSWVLTFVYLKIPTGESITFSGSANGSLHRINVSAGVTLAWLPGEYSGQAYVTKSTERYSIAQGLTLSVLPDLATAGQVDMRSLARRILDFIDASFEKLVKKQVAETTIEGVHFRFRTLKELTDARSYWTAIAKTEDVIAGVVNAPRRSILARFTAPQ